MTRHAAVLGSPIAHSLSPVLHRAAYAALGLTDWSYDAHQVDEASLPDFLSGLDASWAGLSLTMPLKRAVIPLLDEVSATARAVDAVNTVLFAEDGSRTGTNTDIPGLVNALAERGVSQAASAAVLGAGATASSALSALSAITSGEVEVYIRNRARDAEVHAIADAVGTTVRIRDWADATAAFERELVISTTPAGATDELATAVPATPGTLFDVLYHPWPTPLAAAWSARGGAVLGGLDLLVHQAVLQVELMTGRVPAPVAAMRAAGE
ncbi:shikimate dehydrogenase, partial [Catenulispora pinisilvae]|uniref:shikimate dehydrogenase n=1 Tax=Catenulispora pinisilvae TaxID=2705253 RepID=UPI001891955B